MCRLDSETHCATGRGLLSGALEVSSPDGQGALVWRPESEALVQEGACVPLGL